MSDNLRPTHQSIPSLERAVVADLMHTGIVSCPPETPLRIVARMMATNRIHAVVVFGDPRNFADERAWRIVSDLDVTRALGVQLADSTAGDAATSQLHTVTPGDSVLRAAEVMGEHGLTHLVVVDPDLDHPVGIISTLDLATAAGWASHQSPLDPTV